MAVSKKTALLGVDDCKIYPITADTSSTFTCGTGVDVPGIKQISVTLEVDEKELTGDERTLATSAKIKSVTFNLKGNLATEDMVKLGILYLNNIIFGDYNYSKYF